MLQITLAPLQDFAELGERWRHLETLAPHSFFQNWTFLGCRAEARFSEPFLLAATENGHDVALALLNRHAGRLHLGETGHPALDSVFIEHNGILALSDAALRACYRALLAQSPVTLSGIDDVQLVAAKTSGLAHLRQSRFAPALNLATLAAPYLDTLSANTRAQIRRALRQYGAEPNLSRARSLTEALAFFDIMMNLHQESWQRRNQPGAFASSAMRDFHRILIARAWPRGEADLLRISAGGHDIGYLYNFLHSGRIYCYQSGFIKAATPHEKPGLVCHSLAIAYYASAGLATYDMLAGASRYKTSLVKQGQMLHWATLYPKTSLAGMARIAAARLRRRTM
jgi:CelD/BcsL family acetyltransferase involved in cellulose biosynthesis